ncbi:MAG TPA: hypothetical protein DCP08_09045 [Chloroflexi bacterium]|nr:hypothetical protein [Chloroflexota bacterium]
MTMWSGASTFSLPSSLFKHGLGDILMCARHLSSEDVMSDYMTGSEVSIGQLIAKGMEVVSSVPGEHNVHLCNSILDHSQLRFITIEEHRGMLRRQEHGCLQHI